MTWYNVDELQITTMASTIGVEDNSVGNNTGTPILLASLTKTDAEWGNLPSWHSVSANSHGILQTALTQLKSLYPDKDVDLDGIYITSTNV